MTVVQDTSAPLVVVIGATGMQGGSVVRELAASDRPYRIHGLTHGASKPAAQELANLGVEVHTVNIVVENVLAVKTAFKGADIAFVRRFCCTSSWCGSDQRLSRLSQTSGRSSACRGHAARCFSSLALIIPMQEIDEGKLLINAAHQGGARRILWSGLESFSDTTNGKLSHVDHFEGKAVVTKYARVKFQASNIAFVLVDAGIYMTNLALSPGMQPRPKGDGTFILGLPCKKERTLPWIDTVSDYGLFTRLAIEGEEYAKGSEILTSGEELD